MMADNYLIRKYLSGIHYEPNAVRLVRLEKSIR